MEKKTTVPPSAVARTAPCSAPGTSTQTTVTSAGAPTAAATASGSVASATTTRSASPAARSARGLAPRRAPGRSARWRRRRGRRRGSGSRTCRPRRGRRPTAPRRSSTTRAVAAGAPQTSRTARETASGRSSGRTAAIERAKRIAVPAPGTCSERPSQPARPSVMRSGVRVSETRVATRCPTARPSGDSGPTASTTPMSMPPEPVTGFCILPRAADDLQDGGPDRVAVAAAGLGELPEGGGVEVQPLYRDAHLVGPDRGVGVEPRGPPGAATPAGSSTRCTPRARSAALCTRLSRLTRSMQKNLSRQPCSAEDSPVGSPVLRRAAAGQEAAPCSNSPTSTRRASSSSPTGGGCPASPT